MAFVDIGDPLAGENNTQQQIDYTHLGPRFKKHLEYAYLRATGEDRQKCAETLQAVGKVEKSLKRRPYTAMPLMTDHDVGGDGYINPYATTYKKYYHAKDYPITVATRPMTTDNAFAPAEVANHTTHYDVEFARKTPNPNAIYRTGSASGTRNNKPHPNKQFLTWRFPSNKKPTPKDDLKERLTDAKMNEIHRRLCRSTYQSDFIGMPQGYEITENGFMSGEQEKPPYTLNTFTRSTYQYPAQQQLHKIGTSRYANNSGKYIPVYGTLPHTNGYRSYFGEKRTTYDRYYNRPGMQDVNMDMPQLVDLLHNCDVNEYPRPSPPVSYSSKKSQSILPNATPITYTPQPVAY